MYKHVYIEDFCEDLNYQGIILYIGKVDCARLRKTLGKDKINKLWRLEFATSNNDPSMRDFIYVENCDLQNLDYPIYEYLEDGYDIYVLHEDPKGFYIINKMPT